MQRRTPVCGGDLDVLRHCICHGSIDVIHPYPLGAGGFARKVEHFPDTVKGWMHHG